ncbi:MAG: hypothetical protein PHQ90_05940 [Sulfuricurvum sp.]|uniref:capsular polysaccharide export protein, LipB/KpsS family n=1 Tax=Sulfuricurvum sp. TaxID=2025608 RepID=UPI002625FBD5|nr:hypothetical protein [Sulfuricurvum sp.]MDD2368824.1 hypothetical protein [Sulfuricurvum sp.]MDD5118082.1 hypothetical protein [Sulfuricurvum sp.]
MKYFFGFSTWKHAYIELFFNEKLIFINPLFDKNYLSKALKKGLDPQSSIYIWGKRLFPDIEKYAKENGINIFRIEDGFIRSVGLGSDLTQPYSLVVDTRGIYFDPRNPSDLEWILETSVFDSEILERAGKIKQYLIEKRLSKYNIYSDTVLDLPSDKPIIVVPGQVEDDASILLGANGMSNLELLQQVRANRADGYIVYKPHPDVLVGNRIGNLDESTAMKYCDKIVTEVSIDSVLMHADEVHTMTSLVGFEALIRGIKVVTYGLPFYAGWGLTHDSQVCERRTRKLSIDELCAGVYLLYPRYINPYTLKQCDIEEVLEVLDLKRQQFNYSFWVKYRNWMSRKSQQILRMIRK